MGPSENTLFIPQNGGLGVLLSCGPATGTSSRTALPSPTAGQIFCIQNLGVDPVCLAFGDSTVQATTNHAAYQPGTTYIGVANAGGGSAPTHVAGITLAGAATTSVQITAGNYVVLI